MTGDSVCHECFKLQAGSVTDRNRRAACAANIHMHKSTLRRGTLCRPILGRWRKNEKEDVGGVEIIGNMVSKKID